MKLRVRHHSKESEVKSAELIHWLSGRRIECPICHRKNCVLVVSRTGRSYDLRVRVHHDVHPHDLGYFDLRPLTEACEGKFIDFKAAVVAYLRHQPLTSNQQAIINNMVRGENQ
jgi:hypothetical protein